MAIQVDISQEGPVVLAILVDISQEVLVVLVDTSQEVQAEFLVDHPPVVLIHHLEEALLQDTTQLGDQDLPCLHPRHFA